MTDTTSERVLLTVPQAAELAAVSVSTMWRRVRAGVVPAVRVGDNRKAPVRIVENDFLAWLLGPAEPEPEE